METSDIISIISLVFTIIAFSGGSIFVLFQWYKANKIRRSEFFNQIIEKLYFNTDISDAMYFILYNENWYTRKFHKNKKIENKVDALLSYLTYICYLFENKMISKNEFEVLKYEINSICNTNGTKTYLWRHYHYSLEKYKSYAFANLIKYLKNNILNDEQRNKFNNNIPEKSKYKKPLNF